MGVAQLKKMDCKTSQVGEGPTGCTPLVRAWQGTFQKAFNLSTLFLVGRVGTLNRDCIPKTGYKKSAVAGTLFPRGNLSCGKSNHQFNTKPFVGEASLNFFHYTFRDSIV